MRIRSTPPSEICGHRPIAGPQPSTLMMRVRLPLSAPYLRCPRERATDSYSVSCRFESCRRCSRAGSLTEERGPQNRVRGFDSLSALQPFVVADPRTGLRNPLSRFDSWRKDQALVLPDAGARLRSGTRGVRLSARAPHDTNRSSAAMVQQQNARLPASRSGCDSRWPLRCDPRRKVGLISPIKVVRLHPQQDAELVIW